MDDLMRKAHDAMSAPRKSSSRVKSKILSELIRLEQAEGPLRGLSESRDAGSRLCVFEHALALVPAKTIQSMNPCATCHARILGENVERAPIFWPGCPYSRFCGH